MKKYTNPLIVVPWFDTEGMKQRSHLIFKGVLSHRKLRKIVRSFILRNFDTKPTNEYLDALIDANVKAREFADTQVRNITDEQVEAWIQSIEDTDEDEDFADTGDQISALARSTNALSVVREEPSE